MIVAFFAFLKRLGTGGWSKIMLLLFRLLLWFGFWLSCGWLQICGSLTMSVMRCCASGSLVSMSSACLADGRSNGESLSSSLTSWTTGSGPRTSLFHGLHLRPAIPVDEELLAPDLDASRQHLFFQAGLADVVAEDAG